MAMRDSFKNDIPFTQFKNPRWEKLSTSSLYFQAYKQEKYANRSFAMAKFTRLQKRFKSIFLLDRHFKCLISVR